MGKSRPAPRRRAPARPALTAPLCPGPSSASSTSSRRTTCSSTSPTGPSCCASATRRSAASPSPGSSTPVSAQPGSSLVGSGSVALPAARAWRGLPGPVQPGCSLLRFVRASFRGSRGRGAPQSPQRARTRPDRTGVLRASWSWLLATWALSLNVARGGDAAREMPSDGWRHLAARIRSGAGSRREL